MKGSMYYNLYKGDAIAYCYVHFAKQKSKVLPIFKRVVNLVKKETWHDVLILRTNQGKEFLNSAFTKYLQNMNIDH